MTTELKLCTALPNYRKRFKCAAHILCLAIATTVALPKNTSAEVTSVSAIASNLLVGDLISSIEGSLSSILHQAFDRLDLTLIKASSEIQGRVNQAKIQLQGVIHKGVNELDGQQKRLVSDLQSLEAQLKTDLDGSIDKIRSGTLDVISDVRLLISHHPGSIYIEPNASIQGAKHVEYSLHGTALSRAKFDAFKVNGKPFTPKEISRNDRKIDFHVPIPANLQTRNNGVGEVMFSFRIKDSAWWQIWKWNSWRSYASVSYILPKDLGTVETVFVGQKMKLERQPRSVGPFISARVKSSITAKSGRRDDTWVANASSGWKIDTDSVSYKFKRLNGSCSSSRARARISRVSEQVIHVDTHTETDRKPKVTCTTSTTIHFTEFRETPVDVEVRTKPVPLTAGNYSKLSLADTNEERELKQVRASHITVNSPLFINGPKTVPLVDPLPGMKLRFDPATNDVFVKLDYY